MIRDRLDPDHRGAHVGHFIVRLAQRHDAQIFLRRCDGAGKQHRAIIAAQLLQ